MARLPRIQAAGAFNHVTSRGSRRAPVYLDDFDRQTWELICGRVVQRFGWIVHSYVEMTNHFHLLVETPEPNIAAGMQQLNGQYAQTFNKRHGQCGHLFESRYSLTLVQSESHLLQVIRYTAENPVRAGICFSPEEWPWSSYTAIVGGRPKPAFLSVEPTLGLFRPPAEGALDRFRAFVERRDPATAARAA